MQKLTGTASLVYGITFCHNVIYAHVLVKILNMVTDFCVTCNCAGGGLPSYLGMILFFFLSFLRILIYLFHHFFHGGEKGLHL